MWAWFVQGVVSVFHVLHEWTKQMRTDLREKNETSQQTLSDSFKWKGLCFSFIFHGSLPDFFFKSGFTKFQMKVGHASKENCGPSDHRFGVWHVLHQQLLMGPGEAEGTVLKTDE